jgi:hypothetical protein
VHTFACDPAVSPSGVYTLRIDAGGVHDARKLVIAH